MQAGILVAGGTPEERIAAIGTAQHGRLSRWQLLAAGITDSMIRTRVSNGSLIRIRNGVYAVGHTAPMGFAAEVAALLTAPRETLLSHLTAARIWGIHNPASTDPLTIDILVDDGGGRRIDGVREHRTDNPHRLVFAFVHALPLTVPEQTLLDIAPLLTPRELERALDEALTRGLTKRQRMSEAARRDIRRPGSANLRALTPARGPLTLTRSQAEERFLRLIREAGLPAPEINVRLQGFTVDFFWRGAGVVVEIDGYQWHSSRSAFERDRRKDAAIRGAGLVLARFTWEAMERRPLEVVARLAADLAAREGREGREGQKARGQAVFTTS
jgi:very-short-patch-repair endonuclease